MLYMSENYCVVETRVRLNTGNHQVFLVFTKLDDKDICVNISHSDVFEDYFYISSNDINFFLYYMGRSGVYTDTRSVATVYINAIDQEMLFIRKNRYLLFDIIGYHKDQWIPLMDWLEHCMYPHKPLYRD